MFCPQCRMPYNEHEWVACPWENENVRRRKFQEVLQTGWICPRCQRAWAPSVVECPCKPKAEKLEKNR